jgi:hypothetical protein
MASGCAEKSGWWAQPIQNMAPTIAIHTVMALTKMLAVVSIVSLSHKIFRKGPSRPDERSDLTVGSLIEM